jgi:hypothetical protein
VCMRPVPLPDLDYVYSGKDRKDSVMVTASVFIPL